MVDAAKKSKLLSEYISARAGKKFKFSKFLNIGTLTLVFVADDGEQRCLTSNNAEKALREISHG